MGAVYSCSDPAERSEGFAQAKHTFARGGLVVMPTDTVYGVAADAFDATGVRRLLRAKGRGRDMPVPVLIGTAETLRALAASLTEEVRALADAFWPGGLTLICRQQASLRWDIGDSRGTVALRMPDHPVALDLLRENGPLAVSSANLTGQPPATTIDEAIEMLTDAVEVYLDGGATPGPIPSTIVDATGAVPVVVRSGVVTVEQLREVAPTIAAPESDAEALPEELELTEQHQELAELELDGEEGESQEDVDAESPSSFLSRSDDESD